jgi:hypothetical protein
MPKMVSFANNAHHLVTVKHALIVLYVLSANQIFILIYQVINVYQNAHRTLRH